MVVVFPVGLAGSAAVADHLLEVVALAEFVAVLHLWDVVAV